jgi:D-glycero-D-manno-heptose 1,7-bisphosphate phosphatase
VNLNKSVVIGDALTDIDAGLAAGCESILVLTGRGWEQLAKARALGHTGFQVAADLAAATQLVLDGAVSAACIGQEN